MKARLILWFVRLLILQCVAPAMAQCPVAPNQYQPQGNYVMGVAGNQQPKYVPSWIGAITVTAPTKTMTENSDTLQVLDATNNTITITLPASTGGPTQALGHPFCFKAINVNNLITILPKAGDTIDGAASVTMTTLNGTVILESDGTHTWRVISTGGGGGGGSGTVTNFTAGNLSPLFTSSVANPSTTPALSFALNNAGAHTFLGNNTGSTTVPAFLQPSFSDLLGTASSAQIQSSVALAGSPTTTTQTAGDNSTKIATTAYADTSVSNATAFQSYGSQQNPQFLPHFRAGMARVKAGTGFCKVTEIGDSTVVGAGVTDKINDASMGVLRRLMVNDGIAATDSILSAGRMIDLTYDPRINYTAGQWLPETGNIGFAERLTGLASGGGPFTYAPGFVFDTITFYYSVGSGANGSSVVTVDGSGTLATLSGSGSPAWGVTTITVPRTSKVITLAQPTGGNFSLIAIDAWDSTFPAVRVSNCGKESTTSASWCDTNGWGTLGLYAATTPDLVIYNCTINDAMLGTDVNTWKANTQLCINAAKAANCDFLIVVGNPTSGYQANDLIYAAAAKALAAANNCAFYDTTNRWVDYTTAAALGYMSDSIHPNNLGYEDQTEGLYETFRPAFPTRPYGFVNGTAGAIYWNSPVLSQFSKKVSIYLDGYTNASTTVLTFPRPFAKIPTVTGNGTGLTISTISTTSVTIPASSAKTGTIVIEGP